MYPYSVKFRNTSGHLVVMQCQTVLEGQRIAAERGASVYSIKDKGGVAAYEVAHGFVKPTVNLRVVG